MNGKPCPQANLIEALHDGRLGPVEQASCARHVQACASCTALQQELVAIRHMLRESGQEPTQLEHQRARLSLLRAAVGNPRRAAPKRRWALAAGALFAASAMAGVAAWQAAAKSDPVAKPTAATDAATAVGPRAATEPRHLRSATSVEAPVAEAADLSTEPTPPTPGAGVAKVPVRGAARRTVWTPAKAPLARADLAPANAPSPPVTSPDAAPRPVVAPASAEFAAAVAALGSGDFGLAATRFNAFAATYPSDPRVDEAAYLVAISLQRAGRADDAQDAAQRYLREHPTGAHRRQASKIAGPEAL